MKRIKNNKAFTLIELIVVIAILGILVLLAAPKFLGYTDKAKVAELTSNNKIIETASERYYMHNDDWPRLTDEPYTSDEVEAFAEKIYHFTGKKLNSTLMENIMTLTLTNFQRKLRFLETKPTIYCKIQ